MSLPSIRNYYQVPAKRGMHVLADGKPGVIVGARSQYLRIVVDGERRASTWHPTWHIEYPED